MYVTVPEHGFDIVEKMGVDVVVVEEQEVESRHVAAEEDDVLVVLEVVWL